MHTRRKHYGAIFSPWWLKVNGLWFVLSSADELVAHFASDKFKHEWDSAWVTPKWGWKIWLIGIAVITTVFALEYSFRLVRGHEVAWLSKEADWQQRLDTGKPTFVMDVARTPSDWVLKLTNCGGRAARYVNLDTVDSRLGTYYLRFFEVAAIQPKEEVRVDFTVQKRGPESHGYPLWTFVSDNPPDTALTWWDITVKFRDTDNSVLDGGIVRLCFDAEHKYIYATAAPYTERGFIPKQL